MHTFLFQAYELINLFQQTFWWFFKHVWKARPMAFSNWSLKCLIFNSLTLYISEPSKMSPLLCKSVKTSDKEKFYLEAN